MADPSPTESPTETRRQRDLLLEAVKTALAANEYPGDGEWELPPDHWMVRARAAVAECEKAG